MQDISLTLFLPYVIVSFHFHIYIYIYIYIYVCVCVCVCMFLIFCINYPVPLFHFWAWQFSYFSLHPRIVSFDFHATHAFYSSFLILTPVISILCMTVLLFHFVPTKNLSFDYHACHVLFFFLNCLFLLFHLCTSQFCYYSFFLQEEFNYISMQVTSFFFNCSFF